MPCSGHRTGTAQRTHSRGYSIRPVPVLAPPSAFDPIHPDFCSPTSRKTRARRDWKKKRSPFRSLAGHRLCAAATVAPALFPNLAPTRFPVLVLGRIFVVAPLHPRLFFSLFQLQSSTRSKRDVALQPLLPWRPPRPQRRLCRTRPLVVSFCCLSTDPRPAHPPLELPASGMTRSCFFFLLAMTPAVTNTNTPCKVC